jgi:WD40 repeat protein
VGDPLTGHTDLVSSVAVSPDGTRIVSGSWDATIRVWDLATGRPVGEPLTGHTDMVSSVAITPDGTGIVSGSMDHTIRVWDLATGRPVGEPLTGHTDMVSSVAITPDGTGIVSGSMDHTIRVWDLATDECLLEVGCFTGVDAVAAGLVGRDSCVVVAGDSAGSVSAWTLRVPSGPLEPNSVP